MWKQAEVAKAAGLVNEQVESLTGVVNDIKLNHRADIDTLKIELKAMQLFLTEVYPNFDERFQAVREKVRLEISPE